ncbi:hypothetical protein pb186bvf_015541 [Paramecium bursaria]
MNYVSRRKNKSNELQRLQNIVQECQLFRQSSIDLMNQIETSKWRRQKQLNQSYSYSKNPHQYTQLIYEQNRKKYEQKQVTVRQLTSYEDRRLRRTVNMLDYLGFN